MPRPAPPVPGRIIHEIGMPFHGGSIPQNSPLPRKDGESIPPEAITRFPSEGCGRGARFPIYPRMGNFGLEWGIGGESRAMAGCCRPTPVPQNANPVRHTICENSKIKILRPAICRGMMVCRGGAQHTSCGGVRKPRRRTGRETSTPTPHRQGHRLFGPSQTRLSHAGSAARGGL